MSQEEKTKKIKYSLTTNSKVLLSTMIPVVICFALMMVISVSMLNNFSKETAEARFLQTGQKHAFNFERKLNDALNYLSIMSSIVEKQTKAGDLDRAALRNMMMNIVSQYDLIDGSSLYFEPNKFDGKDAYYKGTEFGSTDSGRISWYFYRLEDEFLFLPEAMPHDIEFELPHYTMAKEANAPIFTDPFSYEVDGVDLYMITLTYPVHNSSGNFIGAVTVDIFLDDMFEVLTNEVIYESGHIGIYNNRGIIIYNPIYELIGKSLSDLSTGYELPDLSGGYGTMTNTSIVNGQESLLVIYPTYIHQLDAEFFVSVSAPLDEIYGESRAATVRLLQFSIVVIALIAFLVFILIRRITGPIHDIAKSVDRIAKGEYHTRIEGKFDAEAAVMSDSVNKMAERIEASISDLRAAREAAEKSNRVKGDFLSRMSHEMRTPLNAIIGMSDIAKNSKDADHTPYLEKISDASKHLLSIINDILDLSKIEIDEFELIMNNDFDFRKMLFGVINAAKYSIDEKNQEVILSINDNMPKNLTGDEKRLAQAIANLLSNAIKFTPEKGRIEITAKLIEERSNMYTMQIEIIDNGIGMTESQVDNLFSAFEQIDGSDTRKYGGIGIGLVISKRIIEMMGGHIWVDSEYGKGSTFGFTFMMKKGYDVDALPSLADPESESHLNEDGEFSLSGKTALIADDIEINRDIIMAILEETGLSFDCAKTGKEAVDLFAANPGKYCIIFMDIQMPEMDGYEATMNIRLMDVPEAVTIPIIALTANVFREDVIKCLDAGMNNHVGKPIDSKDLFEKMKIYLR